MGRAPRTAPFQNDAFPERCRQVQHASDASGVPGDCSYSATILTKGRVWMLGICWFSILSLGSFVRYEKT